MVGPAEPDRRKLLTRRRHGWRCADPRRRAKATTVGAIAALLVVCVAGLIALDRVFERLEYETFMLQRNA